MTKRIAVKACILALFCFLMDGRRVGETNDSFGIAKYSFSLQLY